ncbi:alpha/beta fold hydrolase [Halobacillus karajensis]|uniref:AB hydrolase superfamily protein YdjP n=1 Tax=Halobacillus karajensis TaxID=195088 RepID=A0A024P886_9BACI|nr:alpha/beta hydrolase [Halobacillus karajensis]CDQ20276.1 AB hydrolase superfamily protein YdjP [Halobacillus karajensis]CDQ25063.1 AB hydrolase superfamily protein YdjP [Halobacillus karajensis]CDQ28576.1 AB hydrolase superfamily protein YdjP [Halobacillus karajensis]
MPYFNVEDQVDLYYEDGGDGTVVLFIHGVWMSSRFFKKQADYFRKNYRAILLDLRGHGQSSKVHHGHTVANYARDLHSFIEHSQLKNVVLIGWSMGAFIVWDYLQQFGEENIKGTVIVDELPSDFKWDDFPMGAFDFPTLIHLMREVQNNQDGFLKHFIPLMFKKELPKKELEWMLEETTKVPASIASAILFDQTVVDYRKQFKDIKVPTLLCFGREDKLIPVEAGHYLQEQIDHSRLVFFEDSCHCPFLEEPHTFNNVVTKFIDSL